MPFVKLDADGAIIWATHQPKDDVTEEVPITDAGLSTYLDQTLINDIAMREWIEFELGLARVLEDVVDVLIEKGVIRFTDLPDAAQDKLMRRRGLRSRFSYVESLFSADGSEYGDDDSEPQGDFL